MLAPLLTAISARARRLPLDVLLQPGQAERAGRLGDGARVVEDVLDRGADLVCIDGDDLVQQLAAEAEGFGAGLTHRDAVGEQADLIQDHPLPAAIAACMQAASSGSTPITLMSGRRNLT